MGRKNAVQFNSVILQHLFQFHGIGIDRLGWRKQRWPFRAVGFLRAQSYPAVAWNRNV